MKVIMLKDVSKVGRAGEVKEVSDGHAINFLLPKKLAEKATPEKIAALQNAIQARTGIFEGKKQNLLENIHALAGKTVLIKAKTNEKGHLYSEIHPKDIIAAATAQHGISLAENKVKFEGHYKEVGEFNVSIEGAGEKANFTLKVESL